MNKISSAENVEHLSFSRFPICNLCTSTTKFGSFRNPSGPCISCLAVQNSAASNHAELKANVNFPNRFVSDTAYVINNHQEERN